MRSSLTTCRRSTARGRFPGCTAHGSISGTRSVPGLPSGHSVYRRLGGRAGGFPSSALLLQYEEATAREGRKGRNPPRRPRLSRRRAVAKREDEAMANGLAAGSFGASRALACQAVARAGFGPLFWDLGFIHFGFWPKYRRSLSLKPLQKGKKLFSPEFSM